MSLADILEAPYTYDRDVTVVFSYDKFGHPTGFQLGIINQKHCTFEEEHQGLGTPEINKFLVEHGYRPINKRTPETPFDPLWDYRLWTPEWETFRSWLITYYDDQHYREEQNMAKYANHWSHTIRDFYNGASGREKAYGSILAQLREVSELKSICEWASNQFRDFYGNKNRQIFASYKDFCDVLRDYQDLMERVDPSREEDIYFQGKVRSSCEEHWCFVPTGEEPVEVYGRPGRVNLID